MTIESWLVSFFPRPIGIGVQGLADALIRMRFPFESQEASQLNRDIFETLYFGAMEASMELAKTLGPYSTYQGSPISKVRLTIVSLADPLSNIP